MSTANAFRRTSGRFQSNQSAYLDHLERNHYDRAKAAIGELASLDTEGWRAWYDDRENIPAYSNVKQIADLVEARVAELKGEQA